MNALEKYANIAKVRAFLARGMGLKEAIKAAYPDYTPEQVAALAAKMGGGAEKTAAVPLIGAGAGYLKGSDSKRGAEGAIKGALGSGVGGLAGGLLAAPAAIAMADKKKLDTLSKLPKHPALRGSKISRMAALGPKSLAAIILGVGGGSIAGYKALTRGVDKPKGKKKTSAAKKVTFSPAMDKSPSLKGGQSNLPDHIQSAILKKKLKKKLKNKTGSVKMNALEKYVAKTKLASALIEKLAAWGNPDLSGGKASQTRKGWTVHPVKPTAKSAAKPGLFARLGKGLSRLVNMPTTKQNLGLEPMPKAWQGKPTVKSRFGTAVGKQTGLAGR